MSNSTFNTIGTMNESSRDAWVVNALSVLPEGCRILDAGAGEGYYRSYCAHLCYVSQDFAQYNGQGNMSGLQMGEWDTSRIDIVSDITEIPEPDASFDAILCTEVLEHLPDPQAAITEFSRLLRPGGVLLLTAPFVSLTHFAPFHFATGFNRYYYETIFPAVGLELVEALPNGDFFQFLAQEIRRLPAMAERYTGKRIGMMFKIVAAIFLLLLLPFARSGSCSSEVLCFGWHIRGIRR